MFTFRKLICGLFYSEIDLIDKVNDDSADILSTTLHIGGIKSLLEKANKGHDFQFPPNVRAYISSHFQMIRDENKKLNHSIESMKNEIEQYHSIQNEFQNQKREVIQLQNKLKTIHAQLEREKAKNKVPFMCLFG